MRLPALRTAESPRSSARPAIPSTHLWKERTKRKFPRLNRMHSIRFLQKYLLLERRRLRQAGRNPRHAHVIFPAAHRSRPTERSELRSFPPDDLHVVIRAKVVMNAAPFD